MKVADLVRHKIRPEWGIGVIVEIAGTVCEINFEGRGRRKLALDFAERLLETAAAADVLSDSALLDPNRWSELEPPPEERREGKFRSGDRPCEHCGNPLRRSQYSPDKRKKSCPRCSSNDGSEHVYYDTPDAFGTSEKRENNKTATGVQSHCYVCREIDRPYPPSRCSSARPEPGRTPPDGDAHVDA